MNLPARLPKTKIVATIGPSSWDDAVLKSMVDSGMAGARINASFADYAELKRVSEQMRQAFPNVALIVDTKGHKIRVSDFGSDILLVKDQEVHLHTTKTPSGVFLETEPGVHLAGQIPVDTSLLIDDGLIELVVTAVNGTDLTCRVVQGGPLKRRKTVTIPRVHINYGGMSEKDSGDIAAAKDLGFDFVAASFIRGAADVHTVRHMLEGSGVGVISKIEDEQGVVHFEEILEASDGIMVARGDLGLELPAERVPVLQKQFIKRCNDVGKPVIVATQMLQSMTESIIPTRAEINDVANAIFDGTDAVMLSAETATGKHPVEAVQTMTKVALEVEKSVEPVERMQTPLAKPTTNAIARAVFDACSTLPVTVILVATGSGTTARTIARFRPRQPIIGFTKDEQSRRKLALTRGVFADVIDTASMTRDTGVQQLVRSARDRGYVDAQDLVVVVAGANIMSTGSTNMLEINRVCQIISE